MESNMDRKNKNKKKINTDKTMDSISSLLSKFNETDYDMYNMSKPPEHWDIEKVMFLVNKHIGKYDLFHNPPATEDRHYYIASALHNVNLASISITHSFSPTYIGYTHEFFSWKFEGQKSKSEYQKNSSGADILRSLFTDEDKDKEKKPYFFINNFEVINQRTVSIYDQRIHIHRLFNEIFIAFKKVTQYDTEEEGPKKEKLLNQIIFSVFNLIPFILFEFEYLSLTRKNTRLQTENISNVAWADYGLKTTLKVNALFKKPIVRLNTTSAFAQEEDLNTV